MTKVKIATLKSQLSQYLRQVQKGEEVVITDRDRPVAKLVPYLISSERLMIRPAKESPKTLTKLKIPKSTAKTDSLKLLQEDREDRF